MTRTEALKRLGYAATALVLLGGSVIFQGLPQGPVLMSVLVIGGAFADWSGLRAAMWLWRNPK